MTKREVLNLNDMKHLLLGGSVVIPDRLAANVDVEISMEDIDFVSLFIFLENAGSMRVDSQLVRPPISGSRLGISKRLNIEMVEVERHGD